MGIKSIALGASALVLSTSINAAIINADWQSVGDNLITSDSESGLEWLDVNLSVTRSFLDVSSQFALGGDYEGFRYATRSEFNTLFDNIVQIAGNDSNLTKDDIDVVGSAIDPYLVMLGQTNANTGHTLEVSGLLNHFNEVGRVFSFTVIGSESLNTRYYATSRYTSQGGAHTGSWLVRDIAVVPIPAAAWLFGSGLIGLVGLARRKS